MIKLKDYRKTIEVTLFYEFPREFICTIDPLLFYVYWIDTNETESFDTWIYFLITNDTKEDRKRSGNFSGNSTENSRISWIQTFLPPFLFVFLKWDDLKKLVIPLQELWEQVKAELELFLDKLK